MATLEMVRTELVRTEAPSANEFERLQACGQTAFERGSLQEAVELLSKALELAEATGDGQRIDLAFCNLSSARIVLDGDRPLDPSAMNRLREILLRNQDLTNCFLAAYNLARIYELKKDSRKGLFYARIALDRSQLLGREVWIASSRNQIGNFLLAQSYFGEAAAEYQSALDLYPESAVERRALVRLNVGYSLVVRGELGTAYEVIYPALRELRRLGSVRGQMFAHLDLCFAHLEGRRYRDALRHGERGLELAESLGEVDAVKNGLYLLGQSSYLLGDEEAAGWYFSRLESEFYPGSTGISEFLMAVDVRKMINLRA